jgi:hypothetical protein
MGLKQPTHRLISISCFNHLLQSHTKPEKGLSVLNISAARTRLGQNVRILMRITSKLRLMQKPLKTKGKMQNSSAEKPADAKLRRPHQPPSVKPPTIANAATHAKTGTDPAASRRHRTQRALRAR